MNKSILERTDWPKKADGTTDWETLFEKKETGLIAIAYSATSPAELKQNTDVIIRTIFNRKRDQALLGKLTAFLNKLIPDNAPKDHLPALQARVHELLEKIKEERIKRAAVSTAKKRKGNKSNKKTARRPSRFVGFFRRCSDVLGIFLSLFKKKPKKRRKRGKEKTRSQNEGDKEIYFQQAAYVDDGGNGDTQWEDSDLYAMKENGNVEPGVFDDSVEDEEDGKYESWDDY